VGEVDGRYYIAMEHLEGQPLARLKRRAARACESPPLPTILAAMSEVLAGLHHAHELADYDGTSLEVVHRDVTPSNIFITYQGEVKVLDFGIAKAGCRTSETQTGIVKGKIAYMPPEQAMGLDVDRRADIYAVGVQLWEGATGRRMWEGLDDVTILTRLLCGEVPRSPREAVADVPEAIDAICRRALAHAPEDRYPTALELQNDLDAYLGSLGRKSSARDLGQLASRLFENERARTREILDDQLTKVREGTGPAPVLISHPPPSILESGTHESTHKSATESVFQSALPPLPTEDTPEGTVVTTLTKASRRLKRRLGLGIAALAGAFAILVWIGLSAGGEQEPGDESGAVAQPLGDPATTAAASATAPSMIRMTLRAVPEQAVFRVDDGPALDNPYIGKVPADGKEHIVTVSAEGYKTKNLHVIFDKDIIFDLPLESLAGHSGKRAVRVRPAPAPRGDAPPRPRGQLDTTDPWKKQE
jgi:serine/threonine-protein kinase